jgi:hypothetical protein
MLGNERQKTGAATLHFTTGDPASLFAAEGLVDLWKGDIAANWGERHIAAKHGWEAQDRSDTASTLVAPDFLLPCVRVVRVERGQWPGEPARRGIITSFGAVMP